MRITLLKNIKFPLYLQLLENTTEYKIVAE